jgi:hypothetical protein
MGLLRIGWTCWFFLTTFPKRSEAQTTCGASHTETGVFICYPGAGADGERDAQLPDVFHLSAQINAPAGQTVSRYTVSIDGRMVQDTRISVPMQTVSVESNPRSPFSAGSHDLRIAAGALGSAEVKGIRFHPSKSASFCDPFSRFEKRACFLSNTRGRLSWSLPPSADEATDVKNRRDAHRLSSGYLAWLQLYGENLKSIETDVADAIALDAQGNLYAASHAGNSVELRKYSPDGSITYDGVVESCGNGFLSIVGVAITDPAHVWIAGNTTACLPTTKNALQSAISGTGRSSGFVMLMDTNRVGSAAPLYSTYLSTADNRIEAIGADEKGNAYLAGQTGSLEFPHDSVLNAGDVSQPHEHQKVSFISLVNPSRPGFEWSTLLRNAQLTALTVDGRGNVYVTGRTASAKPRVQSAGAKKARVPDNTCADSKASCENVLVAELSDRGRRLAYVSEFGGSGIEEGRAIAKATDANWLFVAGETDSSDFPGSSDPPASGPQSARSFTAALQLCQTGAAAFELMPVSAESLAPHIAAGPALHAFSGASSVPFQALGSRAAAKQNRFASVRIAPPCPSSQP